MSNLIKVLDNVAKKRKELENEVQAVLADGIQEFLIENPQVKAFGWTQYTPYFNDGDTCEFGVREIYVSFTDNQPESFYDDEPEDLDSGSWDSASKYSMERRNNIPAELRTKIVEFANALENAEADLQVAFGDHVRVIATAKGIDVEEYEHD